MQRRVVCQRDCPDACSLLVKGDGRDIEVKGNPSLPPGVVWARRSAKFLKGSVNDLLTDDKQRISEGNALNSSYASLAPLA